MPSDDIEFLYNLHRESQNGFTLRIRFTDKWFSAADPGLLTLRQPYKRFGKKKRRRICIGYPPR